MTDHEHRGLQRILFNKRFICEKRLAVPGNVREELYFDWSFPVLFRKHVLFFISFCSISFSMIPYPPLLTDAATTIIAM